MYTNLECWTYVVGYFLLFVRLLVWLFDGNGIHETYTRYAWAGGFFLHGRDPLFKSTTRTPKSASVLLERIEGGSVAVYTACRATPPQY